MFSKLFKHSSVKNILVITLSNIGDVVLTGPAIDILSRDFPKAKISLVTGAKVASLFEGNTCISKVHIFDKTLNSIERAKWTLRLKRDHYDMVVDFRNTMIGYFLFPKWITPPMVSPDKRSHLKEQHLNRLRTLYHFDPAPAPFVTIVPSKSDEQLVDRYLKSFLGGNSFFIVIAPLAADVAKTWTVQGFIDLTKAINAQYGFKIVMIGSMENKLVIERIKTESGVNVLNLAGCLNLIQGAALLKRAGIAIVHDSGPMHIASYFNRPIVALFGHTDPEFSRPWSSVYQVVRRNKNCPRCLNPGSSGPHECMSAIKSQDVMQALGEVYEKIR
jgi:heptosyltransferase-2